MKRLGLCTLFPALFCAQPALASTPSPAAKPLLVTFPNSSVFLSPYNWRVEKGSDTWTS
jgi:hypothetical protein